MRHGARRIPRELWSAAYPVRVVETVARFCLGAERYPVTERSAAQVASHFARTDEAIAMAAM